MLWRADFLPRLSDFNLRLAIPGLEAAAVERLHSDLESLPIKISHLSEHRRTHRLTLHAHRPGAT